MVTGGQGLVVNGEVSFGMHAAITAECHDATLDVGDLTVGISSEGLPTRQRPSLTVTGTAIRRGDGAVPTLR